MDLGKKAGEVMGKKILVQNLIPCLEFEEAIFSLYKIK